MKENKFSMIDDTCLSKMTDKEMQSWNNELFSLFIFTSLSSLSTSLYGIYPFKNRSATIAFFMSLAFYAFTIVCFSSLISKEKKKPLLNNNKKLYGIISISIFVILLGFLSSFLILKYEVKDNVSTVSINFIWFILFALFILIPFGLLLNHFFLSPINKSIQQFRKNFDENNK